MASVELPSSAPVPPPEKKPKVELDCEQCGLVKSKYTCPKCAFRTCSLGCAKEHKASASCDGQRQPFQTVKKYSQFTDDVSVQDQTFLQNMKESVSNGIRRTASIKTPNAVPVSVNEGSESVVVSVSPKLDGNGDEPVSNDPKIESEQTEALVSRKRPYPEVVDEAVETQPIGGNDAVANDETGEESDFLKKHGHGPTDPNALTSMERYLISNVTRRRIFITVNSPTESDGSRHEQFSDTIYWTIGLNFLRETPEQQPPTDGALADGPAFEICDTGDEYVIDSATNTSVKKGLSVEAYNCKARNIPESLTVNTLIRQFVQPKRIGVVVSKAELDADKMTPFWDAGLDAVLVYMRVPVGQHERYYVVDKTKTVLDNLRNRYVNGHPTFLVVLPGQFTHWRPLSEMEAQELHEERRIKNRERHQNDGNRGGGRGGHRGGRGGRGGGFRGGRGGGGGGGRGRGRGGHRGGRNDGNDRNNRDNMAPCDLASIFEPFPESHRPNRRPDFHRPNEDVAQNGWASAVKSFRTPKPAEPSA